MSSIDPKALKILYDTYWTASGWRDAKARFTPPADFEYAKRAGLMFDEVALSHDDIVERARSVARITDRRAVADAFVVSLSSRRLHLRSALGSFAVLQHFPEHSTPAEPGNCPVCGVYNRGPKTEDLNVFNFERFKWGGVRHSDPRYASFDLKLFSGLPPTSPTTDDVHALRDLLAAIDAAPPDTPAASLEKHLAKVVKSNKSERDILVGILGLCGILATEAHQGYLRQFVTWSDRQLPARRFVDMAYPACWWRRADGIDSSALSYWFGHLL